MPTGEMSEHKMQSDLIIFIARLSALGVIYIYFLKTGNIAIVFPSATSLQTILDGEADQRNVSPEKSTQTSFLYCKCKG